jgi:hypothetical protein
VVTAFHPGAFLDFLGLDFNGPINVPTAWGTLLMFPPRRSQLFFNFSPGTPFSLQVPVACGLIGYPISTQGGSVSVGPTIALANALDIVIGTH